MANKTKQALRVDNNQSFPDNNTGFITPEKLRTFQEDIIDSFVNNADSGSLNIDTGSFATTGSNTFTGTQTIEGIQNELRITGGFTDVRLTAAPDFVTKFDAAQLIGQVQLLSGSIYDDGGFFFYNNNRWELDANSNAVNGIRLRKTTGAILYVNDKVEIFGDLELTSGSATVTAPFFTGSFIGDGSGLTNLPSLDSSSLVTTQSFNEYTQSTDNRLTNIELETASLDGRVSSIENTTSSLETKFATLASTTSSLNTFTSSADNRLDNIESNTGSYARTDTTNQFQQTQTLEQDLVVQGNLYVSGAEVIISSSELIVGDRIIEVNANKVIGDAGLYAFDAIGDQTGSLIWNPNLDYWLAGLSGSEEKVLVSSDTASIESSINSLNDLSGSLLQTASFNEYTESTDNRLTNIELETASLDGRVSSIETFTSSVDTKFDTLASTTSSLNTFTSSQETKNSTLETFTQSLYQTASNDFSEITLTKVDGTTQVLDTTPRQVVESVKNGNGQTLVKGTPVYASGSQGNSNLVFPASASDASTMPAVYILAQELAPDEEGLGLTHGFINGVDTSLFTAGDEIFVGENGGYTNQRPTGTNLIQKLGVVVRSDNNNGSGVIQIDSIRALPNIQEGYIWVGDSDGVPQQVATSSIEENTDLSSLNSFTQSAEGRLDNIEQTTASLESSVSQLVNATASYLERDGDSVISGSISNGFVPFGVGENEIDNSVMTINNTGVFTVGQSTATLPFPQMQMWTNTNGGSAYAAIQILDNGSGSAGSQLETTTFDSVYGFGTPVSRLRMGSQSGTHPGGGDGNVVFVAPTNTSDVQWYKDALWTAGTNIRLESGSAEITGSVDIQGTFTSSLTEGYVWVGDSSGTSVEVSTGSFGGGSTDITALNNFTASAEIRLSNLESTTSSLQSQVTSLQDKTGSYATTGSNIFDAKQTISSSLVYEVKDVTITSQTASIDFSQTNIHTLTLVSGSTTHINTINTDTGQVVEVLVKQPSVGFGDIEFDNGIYEPSGALYTPTQVTDARDVITLKTFDDSTQVFVTNVNRFVQAVPPTTTTTSTTSTTSTTTSTTSTTTAAPGTASVFPNWEQTWTTALAQDYMDALDSLSGSTAQQMEDMGWDFAVDNLQVSTENYETVVVKDNYIIAPAFTTNKVTVIDTDTDTVTDYTLDAGATPSSRMRGGYAPSGSDSVIFTNHNGEFLRFRPTDQYAELFTTSSNITLGPAAGSPDFNWRYYNGLNSTFTNNQDFTIAVDGNTSASIDFINYTGSANAETAFINPQTGDVTWIPVNSNTNPVILQGIDVVATGSFTVGSHVFASSEVVPYYVGGVKQGDDWAAILTNNTTAESQLYVFHNNQTAAIAGSGTVGDDKPRTATIGPNGRLYAYNTSTGQQVLEYDWKNGGTRIITMGGDTIPDPSDFGHRIVTATNGAMYLVPFVNGENFYRISPPLTGSDASNIANMVQSPFMNKGR